MSRKKRESKTNVDLLVPVTDYKDDGSCFGKMWNMKNTTCSSCADRILCGVHFQNNIKKVISKKESQKKFIDLECFDSIPLAKIKSLLVKHSGQYSQSDLLQLILAKSKSKNKRLANAYIKKNFYTTNEFKVINELIVKL